MVSATPRADFAMVRRAVLEIVARSGNALSRDATSAWSSFQRTSAPRRAQASMLLECFAIPPMLRRFDWGVQRENIDTQGTIETSAAVFFAAAASVRSRNDVQPVANLRAHRAEREPTAQARWDSRCSDW